MTPKEQAAKGNMSAILRDIMASWMRDEVEDMLPAVVIAYDPDTNRARVQPLVMLGVGESKVARPEQANVPVFRFGGGGFFIGVPLKPGDLGWIKANDRDISLVMQRGGRPDWPNTTRTHDFNDGMFFPDVLFGGSVSPANEDALVLQSEDGAVCVSIHADKLNLKAPRIEFDSLEIDFVGVFTVNGEAYMDHRHTGVQTGGGNTGPVQP